MSEESKALVPIEERQILFYDDEVTAVLVKEDSQQQIYVPIRPLCDYLGIDWPAQYQRIGRDAVLANETRSVVVTTTDRGPREMICLPLDYLNGWLFGINANRVKDEVRERLIRYQRECYRVLAAAFLGQPQAEETSPAVSTLMQIREMGRAIMQMAEQQIEHEQRITTTEHRLDQAAIVVGDLRRRVGTLEQRVAPGQPIAEEQVAEISQQVKALTNLLSEKGGEKVHYQTIFGELYRRFGVASYRNIPQTQYEAVLRFLEEWRQSAVKEQE